MLLLTGATGTIGRALLRRLVAANAQVRCLVREPERLGVAGEQVDTVVADLADGGGFGRALSDVETVVHLAAPLRDQPRGSIEELTDRATRRLVHAAEQAEAQRFYFFSVLGAAMDSPARLLRAKAAAERAVIGSSLAPTVFASAWVYARDDRFMQLTGRMADFPAVPICGDGRARFEPIWVEDVADCMLAALPGGACAHKATGARYELAGPEALSYEQIVGLAMEAAHQQRPVVRLPAGLVRRSLRMIERLVGPAAFATWDEVELVCHTLLSERGPADARRLGVEPLAMRDALARQR